MVHSDWSALQRILGNIASSAVKFTPDGGSVGFSASYDRESGCVAFAVADSGIGIAVQDRERVFERFVQLDSSLGREYHGSGLGLSLARDLAVELGASIEVDDAPGGGAVFTVYVPVEWRGEPKGGDDARPDCR